MPNEIVRHPRLGSDAARLLMWALSMADEALEPLSATARRAGITKSAFHRAKGQLLAEGYLHEWRRQGARGRWFTEQMISNVPLTSEEALAAREGQPGGRVPAAGEPKSRSVGRPLKNTVENTSNPPFPPTATRGTATDPEAQAGGAGDNPAPLPRAVPGSTPATAVPAATGSVPGELVERGAQVLAAVSHGERRLVLSGREVDGLAVLAGEWLQRGAAVADVREALTRWLPERVHSPAGLIRDRLTRKMPPAPTFAEQRAAALREAAAQAGPRVAAMQECQGEHTQPLLYRPVAGEKLCPSCRCEQAGTGEVSGAAIEAALRGAGAIRAALRARHAEVAA
ncbi:MULTISPECIES: hypothetical protein [Streptomyces]|uniref:hypothetical protein n=1 Tax=Streptomyces TaxID=1883 RepID=UPI00345B5FE0